MSAAITGYVRQLRALGARPAELLNPGTSAAGGIIRANYPGLPPPSDLLALRSVFDGAKRHQGVTVDELWLDGTFFFFSVQEAVDDYAASLPLWDGDENFVEYWPRSFFPIATPGDGSRLLVNCDAKSPTYGAVYELFHGVGVSKSSASIADYFAMASAWLSEGGTHLDGRKCVERDFSKSALIAARLNPGCDSWDNALPPAHETKDWLQ